MGIRKLHARVAVVLLQVIVLAVVIVLSHGGSNAKADSAIQITGTLTTNSGSDVSNVSVYATDPGTDTVEFGPVTSANDGTYDLPVQAGNYDIHFDPPASDNMSSITDSGVMVVNDQTINEEFTVPNYTYSGIITDQNGDPLSNVQVYLVSTTGGPTEVYQYTGNNGAYSITAPAGTYSVQINDAGYNRNGPQVIGQADVSDFNTGSITMVDLSNGSVTQNFAISLSSETFAINDSSGNPEQGVYIKASQAAGTFTINDGTNTYSPSSTSAFFQTHTGVNGAQEGTAVVLIPTGSVFPAATASSGTSEGICVTYSDGSTGCNTSPISVTGNSTIDFNEPPTYTYSGTLTDQYGNSSLAGSKVVLIPVGGSTQSSAVVASDGNFSLTVPEGMYNLELSNTSGQTLATYTTGLITTVDLTQGNQTQNLTLPLVQITTEVEGSSGNQEGQRLVYAASGSANISVTSNGTTYSSTAGVSAPGSYTGEYGSVAILFPEGTSFPASSSPTARGTGVCVDYSDNVYNCSTIPLSFSTDASLIFQEGSTVVQAIAAPGNVAITPPPTGQSPVLTWNSVTGAVSYNIYRQGSLIGSTSSTSFIDTTATPGGYNYYVTAVDSNSNESAPSNTLSEIVYTDPTITSGDNTSVEEGSSFDFTVTTSGDPTPTVSEVGTLPNGVYFSPNNDGTADLSGSSAGGTAGSYPITFTASNSYGAYSTQNFVLTITASAPAITSAASYQVNARDQANFTVTTTGAPAPSITETGNLPTGMTFTDNGDGTATFTGQASPTNQGYYFITITATNDTGSVSQNFVLTVNDAQTTPTFVSANNDTESYGVPFSFTVDTAGNPLPKITKVSGSGAYPAGVTLKDNGDGTATLSGELAKASDSGVYTFTLQAKNSNSTATQAFTLTITKTPVIKNISTKTASVGSSFTQAVSASGSPTPILSISGLPSGLTFTDDGNGTGLISGTPTTGSGGEYTVKITATNSQGSSNNSFTLNVKEGPVITSSDNTTVTQGNSFGFPVTASGYPTPNITESGKLPKGIYFDGQSNVLAGTPAAGTAGTYLLTFTAENGTGTATQTFTLTVQ